MLIQNNTAAQLENMLKDAVPPSQQQNLEWLRKQHQLRKQTSTPSPPHSSTSSSPVFQSRSIEGWQVSDIYNVHVTHYLDVPLKLDLLTPRVHTAFVIENYLTLFGQSHSTLQAYFS